jgi:hypothetical protein
MCLPSNVLDVNNVVADKRSDNQASEKETARWRETGTEE